MNRLRLRQVVYVIRRWNFRGFHTVFAYFGVLVDLVRNGLASNNADFIYFWIIFLN
ncbi:Uncharacterised protein [Vibrio cholerae]|nr:Uncharacterised protein [Vibrio cholerae]CSC27024.1 Uncharacterised protein [Vibrio cholerae]